MHSGVATHCIAFVDRDRDFVYSVDRLEQDDGGSLDNRENIQLKSRLDVFHVPSEAPAAFQ